MINPPHGLWPGRGQQKDVHHVFHICQPCVLVSASDQGRQAVPQGLDDQVYPGTAPRTIDVGRTDHGHSEVALLVVLPCQSFLLLLGATVGADGVPKGGLLIAGLASNTVPEHRDGRGQDDASAGGRGGIVDVAAPLHGDPAIQRFGAPVAHDRRQMEDGSGAGHGLPNRLRVSDIPAVDLDAPFPGRREGSAWKVQHRHRAFQGEQTVHQVASDESGSPCHQNRSGRKGVGKGFAGHTGLPARGGCGVRGGGRRPPPHPPQAFRYFSRYRYAGVSSPR